MKRTTTERGLASPARAAGWAAAVAATALLLSACGTGTAESPSTSGSPAASASQTGKPVTIGFATLWSSVPAVSNVNRGFAAQAEAMGATAKVIEAKIADPLNTQLADMDQLIAQGVDAIAFWPLDDNAYNAVLKRAQEKGIPVFAHDAYAPNLLSQVVTSVTEGRALRAKQGADLICQKLGPAGGEVLYGNFAVAIPTLTFLKEQFTSALAQCPNPVKLVGEFANKTDDVDGGRTAAEAALLAHPDVKAVFSYNDATAIGTAQAASSLNRRDGLWIDGYNLGQDGIDALKSGRIDASWDYRGVQIGQEIARLMVDYARDDSVAPAKVVMVWPKGYTKANIDTLETPDQLLDKVSQGVDLLAAEPTLTSSGSEILTPPADIPSPPLP